MAPFGRHRDQIKIVILTLSLPKGKDLLLPAAIVPWGKHSLTSILTQNDNDRFAHRTCCSSYSGLDHKSCRNRRPGYEASAQRPVAEVTAPRIEVGGLRDSMAVFRTRTLVIPKMIISHSGNTNQCVTVQ